MKKAILGILLAVLTVIMTGCAESSGEKITSLEDLEGKTVAFMSIPIPVERFKAQLEAETGVTLKELLYFDTFSAAVAALKSGKVDAVNATELVADFYTSKDSELSSIVNVTSEGQFLLLMALRTEDAQLLEDVNAALASLRDDGTMDALEENYIRNIQADQQLEGKEMPHFDNAPTYYIGLSGDNPPVDYTAADGKPAGYNVELLSRVSEIMEVNFEIIVISPETKFVSLASKKIDIFFLHLVNYNNEAVMQTIYENQSISFTDPYLSFDSTKFLVMK